MSIGQRIAQKRKELGLSQEILGERLGVSRQAIYKWESDATLPEIEKLVALSRLFGVSVGWLLGVEEAPADPQPESDAMTQAQLDMVEQIVDRYIEAQPKPKKQRRWPWVAAVGILLIVVIQLFGRMDQLTSQYNNLQNSVSNISYSVQSQVSGIASRVEQILKAQNNLTAEYSTRVTATDYRGGTVTIHMGAVAKTHTQGLAAVFVTDHGSGPVEHEAKLTDGMVFQADVQIPLSDSITVSVVFISSDGTRSTQLLETYTGLLNESYVQLSIQEDLMFTDLYSGKLTVKNWYVHVTEMGKNSAGAQIVEYRLGVFRNQKLIGWGEPCEKPAGYTGNFSGWDFFKMPDLGLTDLQDGETIEIAALVTDSYGRQYMVCEIPYIVSLDADGTGTLAWPNVSSFDRDPKNWVLE